MVGGYILGSLATPLYYGAALARRGWGYVSSQLPARRTGMSGPDITIDSNLYLHDLVLALPSMRDHIVEFDDDPVRVTIFGESEACII
ncbi:carboxylesterase family protein [Mycobacterium leprae]|uniref:carboxylesterase family protein n=1 Tax=Mycobacterium leprae TaxID=1769 RepID=UPI000011E1BB|nr:carboxylesterase family protein [Mycobacterium leprae]OAR19792.1 hypothetical protein A8144_03855 [Mycobacterium leprae 3125609]OAX71906.1 hypothetical protein A3216_02895 [Mycobacterium leprae 7935681]